MKQLTHLATRIFGTPLAIQPQKLETILSVIGPRLGAEVSEPVSPSAAGPGDPKDRKPYAVTSDGIAVISITGTLVKRSGWLDALSGMSSYEQLQLELEDAVTDGQIRGVLLDIDSPGGECSGLFDLVDFIYSCRSMKPIWAVSNDAAFSAAYAIASATERIYVTRTGGCGSIGVIALHCDQSAYDAKAGLKYTAIFAGEHKNDFSSHEPLSDQAYATLKAEVDRINDMFVSTVARNRRQLATNIRDTQAGCFFGDAAVALLADKVGTLEQAQVDMLALLSETPAGGRMAAAAETISPAASASPEASATEQATPDPGLPIPQQEASMAKTIQPAPNATTADEEMPGSTELEQKKPTETDDTSEEDGEDGSDDESGEDEDEMENDKKNAVAAAAVQPDVNTGKQIAKLCMIAGKPELAAQYLTEGLTLEQAQEALLAHRAEAQGQAVSSRATMNSAKSFQALQTAATAAAREKGITPEKAVSNMLAADPSVYEYYRAVEKPAFMESVKGAGRQF